MKWSTKNTIPSEQFQNQIEKLYKQKQNACRVLPIHTHTWPLTFMAWYRQIKSGRTKLLLWAQTFPNNNHQWIKLLYFQYFKTEFPKKKIIILITIELYHVDLSMRRYTSCVYYTCPCLIRPLPPKATHFMRPDFRCTEIVKYY